MADVPLADALVEAEKCNRCGYCQPPCPVFRATGVESSCGRGRVQLIRAAAERRLELTKGFQPILFECLLCRACVEACAPKAETDRVVALARREWFSRHGRSLVTDLLFRQLLTDRRRMEAAAGLAFRGLDTGLAKAAQVLGLLRLQPRAATAVEWVGASPGPPLTRRLRSLRLSPVASKLRVGYFIACGINLLTPQAGLATIRLLTALGCEVVPLDNVCCGLPAFVYGDWDAALALLESNARIFAKAGALDAIVTDCGSCSSHLRHAGATLGVSGPDVERSAALVHDLAEFVLSMGVRPRTAVTATVTYHDPCHLSRHQQLTGPPRELLASIGSLRYVELPEADWCCGGAGSYAIEHAEISRAILARKMERVRSTEADVLATACPACIIQLGFGTRTNGLTVRVCHVAEVLADAYGT